MTFVFSVYQTEDRGTEDLVSAYVIQTGSTTKTGPKT